VVEFRVRAQSLGEVAAQLQGVVTTFDAQVAEAAGAVSSVAGASWQGDDAEEFTRAWTEWQAGAVVVRAALTSLASKLVSAQSGYLGTEGGLSGRFGGVAPPSGLVRPGGAEPVQWRRFVRPPGAAEGEAVPLDATAAALSGTAVLGGGALAARRAASRERPSEGGGGPVGGGAAVPGRRAATSERPTGAAGGAGAAAAPAVSTTGSDR